MAGQRTAKLELVTVSNQQKDAGSTAIDVRSLSKHFGPFVALNSVDIAIRENEFFTLLGPSGCGKTTLLRLIAGFEYPTEGQILLYGEDIAVLPPFRRSINTVFQSYALFPHMTVAQNIGFGLKMLGRPKAEIEARVSEMLTLVQMEELKDRRTSQISGGQQQRVALARALAPRPRVLLLDEPLSALDYKLRKDMQIELKRLQHETGITFVFVTHDQEEALTMSDRIAVMNKGRILQVGAPREIYDAPAERFVADFIGESNFVTGRIRSVGDKRAAVEVCDGAVLEASVPEGFHPKDSVTVAVRPEHASLTEAPEDGDLAATIETVIFVGTDTHFHTRLDNGEAFVVREQNVPGLEERFKTGKRVGITVSPMSARVLRD